MDFISLFCYCLIDIFSQVLLMQIEKHFYKLNNGKLCLFDDDYLELPRWNIPRRSESDIFQTIKSFLAK